MTYNYTACPFCSPCVPHQLRKGLSKESAFPFARATLRNTGSAQRTEAAHAEGNGEVLWASSAPFVFEAKRGETA